MVGNHNKIKH
jgi:hypothetical protein